MVKNVSNLLHKEEKVMIIVKVVLSNSYFSAEMKYIYNTIHEDLQNAWAVFLDISTPI